MLLGKWLDARLEDHQLTKEFLILARATQVEETLSWAFIYSSYSQLYLEHTKNS